MGAKRVCILRIFTTPNTPSLHQHHWRYACYPYPGWPQSGGCVPVTYPKQTLASRPGQPGDIPFPRIDFDCVTPLKRLRIRPSANFRHKIPPFSRPGSPRHGFNLYSEQLPPERSAPASPTGKRAMLHLLVYGENRLDCAIVCASTPDGKPAQCPVKGNLELSPGVPPQIQTKPTILEKDLLRILVAREENSRPWRVFAFPAYVHRPCLEDAATLEAVSRYRQSCGIKHRASPQRRNHPPHQRTSIPRRRCEYSLFRKLHGFRLGDVYWGRPAPYPGPRTVW
jgi:hypothetical protein